MGWRVKGCKKCTPVVSVAHAGNERRRAGVELVRLRMHLLSEYDALRLRCGFWCRVGAKNCLCVCVCVGMSDWWQWMLNVAEIADVAVIGVQGNVRVYTTRSGQNLSLGR